MLFTDCPGRRYSMYAIFQVVHRHIRRHTQARQERHRRAEVQRGRGTRAHRRTERHIEAQRGTWRHREAHRAHTLGPVLPAGYEDGEVDKRAGEPDSYHAGADPLRQTRLWRPLVTLSCTCRPFLFAHFRRDCRYERSKRMNSRRRRENANGKVKALDKRTIETSTLCHIFHMLAAQEQRNKRQLAPSYLQR